jgi:D-xylose 1-dehydrogenase (NADP+, D-xylono-1,5-lactone-forming)
MVEPLSWGVLGNAMIARKCVMPAIRDSRNGRLAVLGTRFPDTARELAQSMGIERVVEGYAAVLADPDVSAVYIPLPNHLHHQWTLAALAAGKHVLCEKPLACSSGQAREMAEAARKADRLLMEGFMYRFHPRSRRIHQMVHNGAIGDPKLVRAAFCFRMADSILAAGRNPRLVVEMGGGALLDVGCYGVGTARWLFGKEPTRVQAQAFFHPAGADIHSVCTLAFSGGGLAVVEASFVSALQQTFSVVGTDGVIDLPHDAYIPWQADTQFTLRKHDASSGETIRAGSADEYRLMIEHFADAVAGHSALEITLDESIANMRVLDALAEAMRTGASVRLA